jgi:hypothetical protein
MLSLKLPGWDEYHETHSPWLGLDEGVLWIPKEHGEGEHSVVAYPESKATTEDEFIRALMDALRTPIEQRTEDE